MRHVSRLIFRICISINLHKGWNANSVLLQKRDIDLLKTVAETNILIRRLIDERIDAQVWEALFATACEIAL